MTKKDYDLVAWIIYESISVIQKAFMMFSFECPNFDKGKFVLYVSKLRTESKLSPIVYNISKEQIEELINE